LYYPSTIWGIVRIVLLTHSTIRLQLAQSLIVQFATTIVQCLIVQFDTTIVQSLIVQFATTIVQSLIVQFDTTILENKALAVGTIN